MTNKELPKYMQRLEAVVETLDLSAEERAKLMNGVDREQALLLVEAIEGHASQSYKSPVPNTTKYQYR